MGSSPVPYLIDTEEEVVRLLVEIGLKKNEARILVVFFRGIEPTSREIERITDLRQPDVSIGISELSKHKWVGISSLITANKGRPVKVFVLTKTIDTILDELSEKITIGYDQQMLMLKRIREIIQDIKGQKTYHPGERACY